METCLSSDSFISETVFSSVFGLQKSGSLAAEWASTFTCCWTGSVFWSIEKHDNTERNSRAFETAGDQWKKSYLICVVAAPEVGVSSSNKGSCETLSFNEIRQFWWKLASNKTVFSAFVEETLSSSTFISPTWGAPLSLSVQVLLAIRWHLSRSLSWFGSRSSIWGFKEVGVLTGGPTEWSLSSGGLKPWPPGSTWFYLILPGGQWRRGAVCLMTGREGR